MNIRTLLNTHILALSLFALSFSASAAKPKLNFPKREASTVGICVMDLKTGEFLAAENYNLSMAPASTMKAVTTATALQMLGADFKFVTDVTITTPSATSTFNGNINVYGSGDPTIESRHFPDEANLSDEIINALDARGIREGQFSVSVTSTMADEGVVPSWTIADTGWSYGTGIYGFNCFDNYFEFNTTTYDSEPSYPFLNVELEENSCPNSIMHGIRTEDYYISGRSVGRRNYTVRLPMNSPAEVFEFVLSERLETYGLKPIENDDIIRTSSAAETLLLKHQSPILSEISKSLMFRSDNMMAEAILRAIAPGGTRDDAINLEKELWESKGLNHTTIAIEDGSGLSRKDRLTPRFLNELLAYMARSDQSDTFVSFFPAVGNDGTVRSLFRKSRLKGKLLLKSGSLSGVQCFAGYKIDSESRPTHTIVIFINNFFCSRAEVRAGIEKFLLDIF